jgi:hypothetical protein
MCGMKHARRLVLCACTLALSQAAPASTGTRDPVRLIPLSATKLDHCERSGLLRAACPRVVPRVGAPYLSNLSVELTGRSVLDVFNLERGGEYPRAPERNAPPRMAHVVAVAGNVERLASFREPRDEPGNEVRDGLVRRSRAAPLSFGHVRWGGRLGALYLMPSYPRGGMLGNHLVFSWRQDERPYALSLHAWEPLTESVATLRSMVEGLPNVAEAERLTRLSPVRRLTLPRGRATARATITAPPPPSYAFDVFVVVPARADVGVRIQTATRATLRVLDSTRSPSCRTRRPYRTCLLHFPRLEAVQGGRWTLVVTKRSVAPARVRVDVSFR